MFNKIKLSFPNPRKNPMKYKKSNFFPSIAIAGLVIATIITPTLTPSFAKNNPTNAPHLVLNPGGGQTGADGLLMEFNTDGVDDGLWEDSGLRGSDQVWFDGDTQWCCSGAGPILAIGSTAFGEAGAAFDFNLDSFSSIVISHKTGKAYSGTDVAANSGQQGDASARITYTKVVGGRSYVVMREITYIYPNNFYDETWTVTIPAGNTEIVKLYVGGDAAPGASDSGRGATTVSSGLRTIYEANPLSGQYISYSELGAGSEFTHYYIGSYSVPYMWIKDGLDLTNTIDDDPSPHDAGMQVQWTFGVSDGDFSRQMRTAVGLNSDVEALDFSADQEESAPEPSQSQQAAITSPATITSLAATGNNGMKTVPLLGGSLALGLLGALFLFAHRRSRQESQ